VQFLGQLEQLQALGYALLRDRDALGHPAAGEPSREQAGIALGLLDGVELRALQIFHQRVLESAGLLVDRRDERRDLDHRRLDRGEHPPVPRDDAVGALAGRGKPHGLQQPAALQRVD
jgi:hypothetical protein